MKKINNNIFYFILGIIFALSSAMLSFQLIIDDYYLTINIIFTATVSFLCAIWFWIKTARKTCEIARSNIIFTIVCIIATCMVMMQLYLTKGVECREIFKEWIINPFRVRYFIISIFSAMYIGIYIGNKIKEWILDLYHSLDTWDKKAYIIATVISFFLIAIAYSSNANWYLQYDKVYSLDSGWCFKQIFPHANYYDIRHPILSVYTFPIWAIVTTVVNMFLPGNLSTMIVAILLQLFNAQLLILIGLQLKILTQSKWVFIFYMISFQTMLYTMFFEKYQLCTFLVVLYVFTICNKKDNSTASLIASAGAMPTSCFIGVSELFTSDKLWTKIKKISKIVLITVLTFICLGRGHVLQYGMSEMLTQKEKFSNKSYTMQEKMISTTKVFQGALTALPSNTTANNKYLWEGLESNVSLVTIVIIMTIITGGIVNRKKNFVKISAVWSIFAVILFVLLNWSTHETPLFAIYFSWAIIPLFVLGIDWIVNKIKANPKIVYTTITGIIMIVNIATIFDIQKFLQTL